MFCSTAEGSSSNFILFLYPGCFSLCKKCSKQWLQVEEYTVFDLLTENIISVLNSSILSVSWYTNIFWKPSSPKNILTRKWIKLYVCRLTILSCSAFYSEIFANVCRFSSKANSLNNVFLLTFIKYIIWNFLRSRCA